MGRAGICSAGLKAGLFDFRLLRHGIEPKGAGKGVAAQEPAQGQPGAAGQAEAGDGFAGVLRAGGMEAAASGEEHGEMGLVDAQGEEGRADV